MTDGDRTGPEWGRRCPKCGHTEATGKGPGFAVNAPDCPECGWPMNSVDLTLIDTDEREQ